MASDEQAISERAPDASAANRPGVPQKQEQSWVGHAHWSVPPRQDPAPGLIKDAQREHWTATFGTGQKPRGVSGAMRRIAYRIPDYRIRRWLLLLLADRVDAIEARFLPGR
jgi:hypothetical protein